MHVISLTPKEKNMDLNRTYWLRRQAMQLVNQLPESREDALQVLEYARKFHAELLADG